MKSDGNQPVSHCLEESKVEAKPSWARGEGCPVPRIARDWWGCSVQLIPNVVCEILDRIFMPLLHARLLGTGRPGAEAQFSFLVGAL